MSPNEILLPYMVVGSIVWMAVTVPVLIRALRSPEKRPLQILNLIIGGVSNAGFCFFIYVSPETFGWREGMDRPDLWPMFPLLFVAMIQFVAGVAICFLK